MHLVKDYLKKVNGWSTIIMSTVGIFLFSGLFFAYLVNKSTIARGLYEEEEKIIFEEDHFTTTFSKQTHSVRFETEAEEIPGKETIFTKIAGLFKKDIRKGIAFSLTEAKTEGELRTDIVDSSSTLDEHPQISPTQLTKKDGEQYFINQDILEGIDIKYSILEGKGIKEEIIIRKKPGLSPHCKETDSCELPRNQFMFNLELDEGVELRHTLEGSWYMVDENGNYLAHIEPLFAVDAENVRTNSVTLDIDGNQMIITLDLEWLMSPTRVYPVTIDPSIVHDTEAEFLTGVYDNLFQTSDPQTSLAHKELSADEYTVALYHFDETANDSCSGGEDVCDFSGNGNHGTATGTTINSSDRIVGSGTRSFNGSSDFVEIPNHTSLNPQSAISIEFWLTPEYLTAEWNGSVVDKIYTANGPPYHQYAVSIQYDKVYFALTIGGTLQSVTSSTSLNINEWNHVAAVYDGNVMLIYINGVVDSNNTLITGTINQYSTVVRLGAQNYNKDYWVDGLIDELRISNIARTPEEIRQNAQQYPSGVYTSNTIDLGTSINTIDDVSWEGYGIEEKKGEDPYVTSNLVAQWNLNETSGTTVTNSAGESSCGGTPGSCNGTLLNFADTSGQDVAASSGWSLDNAYAGSGSLMFDGTNDYVTLGNDSSLENQNFTIEFWAQHDIPTGSFAGGIAKGSLFGTPGSYEWEFYFHSSTVALYISDGSSQGISGSFTDTGWHLWTGVVSADEISIYQDGALFAGPYARTKTINYGNHRDLVLSSPSYPFNGIMDSVKYYSTALTAQQIEDNYYEYVNNPVLSMSSDSAYSYQFQTRTSTDGSTWEAWTPSAGDAQILSFDTYQYDSNSPSGLLSYWPMNETSGTAVDDPKGGHDGTANGTTIVSGRFNNARDFNGTSDYVQITSPTGLPSGATSFTIEAWIYPSEWDRRSTIFCLGTEDYLQVSCLRLADEDAGGIMHYFWGNDLLTATDDLTDGWHHVGVTYDGTNRKIYLDGRMINSDSPGAVNIAAGTDAWIGRRVNGTELFYGQIDEVRIYDEVLTEFELYEKYQEGHSNWSYTAGSNEVKNISITAVETAEPFAPAGCQSSKQIRIDNPSNSDLTDYQVRFRVNSLSGMSSDFSDLRFRSSSQTDLDYWIQEYTSSDNAIVWVEVDSIPANSSTQIVMHYDSCTGGNSSDGDDTFLLFDDFAGTTLDSAKWSTYNQPNASVTQNDVLELNNQTGDAHSGAHAYSVTNFTKSEGIRIYTKWLPHKDHYTSVLAPDIKIRKEDANRETTYYGAIDEEFVRFGLGNASNTTDRTLLEITDTGTASSSPAGTTRDSVSISIDETAWHELDMMVDGSSAWTTLMLDDQYMVDATVNSTSWSSIGSTYKVELSSHEYNKDNTEKFDDFALAKYVYPSPVVTILDDFPEPFVEGTGSIRADIGSPIVDHETLKGYWKFDETNGDTVSDDIFDSTQNNHNGEFVGSGIASAVRTGVIGKSRYFNGADDYIEVPASDDWNFYTEDFSISFWFNQADAYDYRTILSYNDFNGWTVFIGASAFYFYGDVGTNYFSYTPQINEWVHGAIVHKDGALKIYFNGVESYSTTLSTSISGSGVLKIGNGSYGAFKGMLDDVMVLKGKALGIEEVNSIYELGANMHLIRTTSSTDLSSNTNLPFWVAADEPGSFLELGIGESSFSNYADINDENLAAEWTFEEVSNDTTDGYVEDVSKNSFDAQLGGGTSTYVPAAVEGVRGYARMFDGSNDYIKVPNSIDTPITNSTLSIDAWVKSNNSFSTPIHIFNRGVVSTSVYYGFQFSISSTNITFIRNEASTNKTVNVPITLTGEESYWHHVAVTYDKTTGTVKAYLDGVYKGTGTVGTGTVAYNGSYDVGYSIGALRRNISDAYSNATIDQVRIYDRILSDTEISGIISADKRTYPITIDFGASLDSGDLISGSGDTSFTIDATTKGFAQKGSNLNKYDNIIIKENYAGTEYMAQAEVTSINKSTGAVVVASWESGSTFPTSGYSQNATVMKWQQEWFDIRGIDDAGRDGVTTLTYRVTNGNEGRTVWLDDMRTSGSFLIDPSATSNITSTDNRYIQYRFVMTSYETSIAPWLDTVTVSYTEGSAPTEPTNDLLMRHGKWFNEGSEQNFWWVE